MTTTATIEKTITLIKKTAAAFKEPSITTISRVTRNNPYKTLISCIISLRTRDSVTAAASQRLFALADNPHDMLALQQKTIEQSIYPAGFYKTKAQTILRISHDLITLHQGKVPNN